LLKTSAVSTVAFAKALHSHGEGWHVVRGGGSNYGVRGVEVAMRELAAHARDFRSGDGWLARLVSSVAR
jgi:hypothetical protein